MPDLPTFVDVDGTLTTTPHSPWGAPVEHRIEYVRAMIRQGKPVVIWSANGGDYATAFAAKHGIEGAICIGKPEKCVDDNPTIRKREVMPILSPEEFFGG